MLSELTHVYEIYSVSLGIQVRLCYAEGIFDEEDCLQLVRPFQAVRYYSDLGVIWCRIAFDHTKQLTTDRYDYTLGPVQDWMALHYEDVVAAGLLCAEVSRKLPKKGFRRL